jgi:hypothetical protein
MQVKGERSFSQLVEGCLTWPQSTMQVKGERSASQLVEGCLTWPQSTMQVKGERSASQLVEGCLTWLQSPIQVKGERSVWVLPHLTAEPHEGEGWEVSLPAGWERLGKAQESALRSCNRKRYDVTVLDTSSLAR